MYVSQLLLNDLTNPNEIQHVAYAYAEEGFKPKKLYISGHIIFLWPKNSFYVIPLKCLSVSYIRSLSVPYKKCLSVPYIKCLSVPRNFLWLIVSVANTPSLLGRHKPSNYAGRRPAI